MQNFSKRKKKTGTELLIDKKSGFKIGTILKAYFVRFLTKKTQYSNPARTAEVTLD